MTFAQILSLLLLLTCLVAALLWRINIGVLALGSAAILLAVSDYSYSDMYKHSPAISSC